MNGDLEGSVADLGCGTGNASLSILQQMPSARIFLLDGSQRMVEIAAEKLERSHPGSMLGRRVADLCRDGWRQGLEEEGFDAVVSTLVLEHLPFPAYRAAVDGCLSLLRPGGWLLSAEGYSAEGSDMQEWFYSLMDERRRAVEPQISDFIARLREEKETHYYCSQEKKAYHKAGRPFGRKPEEDKDTYRETEYDDVEHDCQLGEPGLEILLRCLIHHSYLNAWSKSTCGILRD